ncbi:hypothetical protein ABIB56_000738 [Glaciihabitans sp. UYNi722]
MIPAIVVAPHSAPRDAVGLERVAPSRRAIDELAALR